MMAAPRSTPPLRTLNAAPYQSFLEQYERHTPGGKLATMADVVDATQFLLRNRGVSAVNLPVDRGTVLM